MKSTEYAAKRIFKWVRRRMHHGAVRAEVELLVMENRFPLDLSTEQPIQIQCDKDELRELLALVQRMWEQLGKDEPYWSVRTQDAFRISNFQQNEEQFWNSEQGLAGRMLAWARRNGIELRREWVCLDYGCGAGRTTRWLCKEFDSVMACDISAPHLALAREKLAQFGYKDVRFIQIANLDLLEQLPEFDVLFSMLVLQHNPPPVMAHILDRLLNKLNPGGIAFFQIPTFHPGYSFTVRSYLDMPQHPELEMHFLPQRHVFRIAAERGCDVVEVQPDSWTGSLWETVSTTFLLRKPGAKAPVAG